MATTRDAPARTKDARPSASDGTPSQKPRRTYGEAVASGFYQRDTGGLRGKHDNVRRYWEDQITRYVLHDFLDPLVKRKRRDLSRVRVVDLGAGSGEGYEILTSLKKTQPSLISKEVEVMPAEALGYYKGLDISPAMVEQGREIYQTVPKVAFEVGDLSQGLGDVAKDDPYDVYFSSYGSLSHLDDDQLGRLVGEICEHLDGSCVFVADLVGRYSFEWQCYWDAPATDAANMRQYSMSYLYPEHMLEEIEVERFPLRYWGAEEFRTFMEQVTAEHGVRIRKHHLQDRSVLVGRHMNTGEFNPRAQPIRRAVNHLHEVNVRTDLTSLIFDYAPHEGYPRLNEFFESFQMAWNALVYAAIDALEHWDDPEHLRQAPPSEYPSLVRTAIRTIRDVVRNVTWFRMGDPRANVVEPQLGYILRNLEVDLQQAIGCGHGLLGIYELEKDEG